MRIELTRTLSPEDWGTVEDCSLCGADFELGVVFPMLLTNNRMDAGFACENCIAFMGRHPSGRFPTIERYRWLEAAWGAPLYESSEEADRALGF
jgi:hypothetical protein